ncbi:hypothetical protein NL676_031552 [Syzygium grande]|nr:hypothetical protein NL676_031552 [Syzygium grande]
MTPTLLMSASGLKKLMNIFLSDLTSSPALEMRHLPISFLTDLGHHSATFLPSFENRNSLPAGLHKIAIRSPSSEVLKTGEFYLLIRSRTNFSRRPPCWQRRNSRLSLMTSHPKLPSGVSGR